MYDAESNYISIYTWIILHRSIIFFMRQQVTIAWISVTFKDGVQKICSIIQDYKHLEPQKEEKGA